MSNETTFTSDFKHEGTSSFEFEKRTPSGLKVKIKYYVQKDQSIDDARKDALHQFEVAYAKALMTDLNDVVKNLVQKYIKETKTL